MEKVSATGVENYTEKIGSNGAVMYIRVETTQEGILINAPIKKGKTELAVLARQQDGKNILLIKSGVEITTDEFYDIFKKSAEVIAEIIGIK